MWGQPRRPSTAARARVVALGMLMVASAPAEALAQGPSPEPSTAEPGKARETSSPKAPAEPMRSESARVDRRLAAGGRWPAGSVEAQLDADATLIPFGKGAIFVPAMTSGLDEPPIEVLKGDDRVAEGTAGSRIPLFPGTYTVRIGSGASQQRMTAQATVRELATTVIPVSWSGLTVHVVDPRYNSLRASYELIRVSDREYVGIGFGTDEQAGEPISTWVLRPGLYKIVRVGENYRARRDFVTVRLVRGKHTHFLLVLNEETGEFAGGGEVPADELFLAPSDALTFNLVVGGDVTGNYRENQPGLPDQLALQGRAFVDGLMSAQLFDNPLIVRLQVEEGFQLVDELSDDRAAEDGEGGPPIQLTRDRLELDALYVYRLEPWIGPYARGELETNLFTGTENFEDERDVVVGEVVQGPDGEEVFEEIDALGQDGVRSFDLRPPFGVTSVREGIGLNVRAFKTVAAELNLRTGLGALHQITNDVFRTFEPETTGSVVAYVPVRGTDRVGAELTLLGTLRLTRYLILTAEVEALITPFRVGSVTAVSSGGRVLDPIEESFIEAEGSALVKLTSFLSLNFVTRYVRDATINPDQPDQIETDLLLRFSVKVL